jgi:hypothetical protein
MLSYHFAYVKAISRNSSISRGYLPNCGVHARQINKNIVSGHFCRRFPADSGDLPSGRDGNNIPNETKYILLAYSNALGFSMSSQEPAKQ